MAKTPENARVYDGLDGGVWLGASDATLPTTLSAPGSGFEEAGWMSDEGVSVQRESEREEKRAWQGKTIIRITRTNTDTIKFQMLEETTLALGLMYAGATFDTTSGVTTVTVPLEGRSNERAIVADMVDPAGDTVTKRYCGVVDIASTAEVVHQADEFTVYEFTGTFIGTELTIITDNPAVEEPA